MSPDDESMRVQLARMEGKLDLSNLRHDQTEARLSSMDTRLHGHGERISGLEGRERERTGERRGLTAGGRIAWAGISALAGTGIGAVLLRLISG
jgi:hypothetical protein